MSVIIEYFEDGRQEWGVSFTSHNPEPKNYVACGTYEDAVKLSEYVDCLSMQLAASEEARKKAEAELTAANERAEKLQARIDESQKPIGTVMDCHRDGDEEVFWHVHLAASVELPLNTRLYAKPIIPPDVEELQARFDVEFRRGKELERKLAEQQAWLLTQAREEGRKETVPDPVGRFKMINGEFNVYYGEEVYYCDGFFITVLGVAQDGWFKTANRKGYNKFLPSACRKLNPGFIHYKPAPLPDTKPCQCKVTNLDGLCVECGKEVPC